MGTYLNTLLCASDSNALCPQIMMFLGISIIGPGLQYDKNSCSWSWPVSAVGGLGRRWPMPCWRVWHVRHFTMGWFLKQLKLCEGTSKGTACCQCKWLRTCRQRMGNCWWCWDHRVWYFRARSILTLEICHAHCISLCSSTRLCCGCGHAQQIPKSQGLYSWIWSKGLASFIATGSPLWHLRILVPGLMHTQHRLAGHKVNWSNCPK